MPSNNWTIAPCGGIRLDKDSFEILYDDKHQPYISSTGGGGGTPAEYLKEAEILADGGLKITKKDGSEIIFADGGFVKNITVTSDEIKVTKQDDTVVSWYKLPQEFIKKAEINADGDLVLTRKDDTKLVYAGGEPEEYLKKVEKTDSKLTFTDQDDATVEVEFTSADDIEAYLATRN